jgi:hypothetical protein
VDIVGGGLNVPVVGIQAPQIVNLNRDINNYNARYGGRTLSEEKFKVAEN